MNELIIFTIAGSNFHFKNVEDFNRGSDHISFSYSGQITRRRNSATFYHISMAGYSWLGEEEHPGDGVYKAKGMAPKEDSEYFKSLGQIL